MSAAPGAIATDTSDMVALHQVFRRAIADAGQLTAAACHDGPARAEAVWSYYDTVLRLLDAHHQGEDELLTPKLLARCQPGEAAGIRRIAGQHEAVQASAAAVRERLSGWRAAPTVDTAASLTAALAQFGTALTAHLDDEEALVLPLAAQYLIPAEWAELPGHSLRRFSGTQLWLILGLVLEQMSPRQAGSLRSHMPAALSTAWETTGSREFLASAAALRG